MLITIFASSGASGVSAVANNYNCQGLLPQTIESSSKYPEKKWIKLILMPMLLGGPLALPSAKAVNYLSWGAVGIFFNYYVFRRYKSWWARHNYILSAALDAGVAFMGVLLYFTLQSYDISGPEWWGLDSSDHCPLAQCPIAPGIEIGRAHV